MLLVDEAKFDGNVYKKQNWKKIGNADFTK